MRILAYSDVRNWEGFEEVITEAKPNILAFAGDLVSDGYADFWDPSVLKKIPGFTNELNSLFAEYVKIPDSEKMRLLDGYEARLKGLEWRYRNRPEFQRIRRDSHVERFYQVLEFASNVVDMVLVVRGDHDDGFPGEYDVERIDATKNCHEISGHVIEYKGLKLLGLGYHETRSVMTVRKFADSEPSELVITHAQEKRIPELARLRTKVILRGHFRSEKTYRTPLLISANPPVLVETNERDGALHLGTRYFVHPKPREAAVGESYPLESKHSLCTHCGRIQEYLEAHLENCPFKDGFEI